MWTPLWQCLWCVTVALYRDQTHVDWVKAWVETLTELQAFVKQHHTTGLVWAKKGAAVPPPPPPGGMPPPPPLLPSLESLSLDSSGQDRSALFAQINKGEDITKSRFRIACSPMCLPASCSTCLHPTYLLTISISYKSSFISFSSILHLSFLSVFYTFCWTIIHYALQIQYYCFLNNVCKCIIILFSFSLLRFLTLIRL